LLRKPTPPDLAARAVANNQTDAVAALRRTRRIVWWFAAALLAWYAVITIQVAARKGLSFDEGEEIAVGYNLWQRHDFRMEAANGDFIKRWATLPFLLERPRLPGTDEESWRKGWAYEFGFKFCFTEGNDLDRLLRESRAMVMLLGVATGLLVFCISRRIFGELGGLISLGLFVFSPNMLAHGAIVSTEMSLCLTLLGATWFAWRLLHAVTWGNLAGSIGFVALLVLAKPTALLIIPIAGVFVAARLCTSRALEWKLGPAREIQSRGRRAGVFAALIAIHVLAAWTAIWAHYEFRYVASSVPSDPAITMPQLPAPDPIEPRAAALIGWSRRAHFLPEAYLHWMEWLLRRNESRVAFLDGHWTIGGWWHFFPRAMWLKSRPAFLVLMALGLIGWIWFARRRASAGIGSSDSHRVPPLYEAIPWVTLVVVYFGVAMQQDLNIGHRHILPVYPALHVLTGSIAVFWQRISRWFIATLAALLVWLAVDSTAAFPHYLAYFNPLAGGAANGYKHLVDSSLDWGMNLPEFKDWLDRNNPDGQTPVFLAYFGTDSPAYRKIACRQLPSFFEWRPAQAPYALTPGLYAISATLLQGVYTDPLGPWATDYEANYQNVLKNFRVYEEAQKNPEANAEFFRHYPADFWQKEYASFERLRFGRLCAWLRHQRPPLASVGHAILIWKLEEPDLQAALYGPPPEIDDSLVTELKKNQR
jgi:hypothetical protein